MKKILIYLYDLEKGGVPNVTLNWIKYMSKYFKIDILLYQNIIQYDLTELNNTNLVFLHKYKKIKAINIIINLFMDSFYLNRIFKKYDYIIVNVDLYKHTIPIMFLYKILNMKPKFKLIGWLHACLDQVKYYPNNIIKNLHIKSLNYFKTIICVSNIANNSLLHYTNHKLNSNLITIYNTSMQQIVAAETRSLKNPIQILSIGRLGIEKGFDLLIKAIINLHKKYQIKLIICGDGNEREKLQHIININNASKYIKLLGVVDSPSYYYKTADIFISSSITESFSMVVMEALIHKIPVIATNTGATEILENDTYGITVPINNLDKLINAIEKLITDPVLYEYYANNGYKALEKFNPNKIYNQWLNILTFLDRNSPTSTTPI